MDRHAGQAERLGALQLVGEHVHRPRPGGRLRAGQVDQVARVREGPPDAGGPARRVKGADLVAAERACRPLPLVLDEDLHREAPELVAALERQVQAAGDRDVRADLVASGRPHPGRAPNSAASRSSR
jgi:hypothetical protein